MFYILLLAVAWCGTAHADDNNVKNRIVNACIGEAEGESYQGKKAVVCSIMNRVHKYGSLDKALKGVYGEHSNRVINHKYPNWVKDQCTEAYTEALDVGTCDFIEGATHWEGTAFKTPYWAKNMTVTATIGHQRFYK